MRLDRPVGVSVVTVARPSKTARAAASASTKSGLAAAGEGDYQLTAGFPGNGLLTASSTAQTVTIARDFTLTTLNVAAKIRWGHQDPFTVTLTEPNAGQHQGPLPVVGENFTITLTGPLGTRTYPVGPTAVDGTATITPLMTMPPGDYHATACFAEDPWFKGSCSGGQTVRATFGYTSYASGGRITVTGGSNTAVGDLHSKGSLMIGGTSNVLAGGAGERFEYVTTFTDVGNGNQYNKVRVPPQAIAPATCGPRTARVRPSSTGSRSRMRTRASRSRTTRSNLAASSRHGFYPEGLAA
jgi:hypothetical protein